MRDLVTGGLARVRFNPDVLLRMCRGLFRVVQNQIPKDAVALESGRAGSDTLDLEVLFTSHRCPPVRVDEDPPLWPSPMVFCHPDAGSNPREKLAQAAAFVAEQLRGMATPGTRARFSTSVASQLWHILEQALCEHDQVEASERTPEDSGSD